MRSPPSVARWPRGAASTRPRDRRSDADVPSSATGFRMGPGGVMSKALRLVTLAAFGAAVAATSSPPTVMVMPLAGVIGPASADYVERGLARAAAENVQLVVLQMDTPGGLDTSMREIIKAILAAPVPVATFVTPSGARAASAGTYILYASHVAAMAPGTNLGAATPVAIGIGGPSEPEPAPTAGREKGSASDKEPPSPSRHSALAEKQINDAAAYIRSLAQLRGRNADWGEKAVRDAVSLTAEEAQRLHVVDHVVQDVPALLARVDGSRVVVNGKTVTLALAGAELAPFEPDWRTKLLGVIASPSL